MNRRTTTAGFGLLLLLSAAALAGCGDDPASTAPTTAATTVVTAPQSVAPVATKVIPAPVADVIKTQNASEVLPWVTDIVVGTIGEVGPSYTSVVADDGFSFVYTPVTIKVTASVYGKMAADQAITFTKYGGTADGVVMQPVGAAIPKPGEEVLALLDARPERGSVGAFDLFPIVDGILRYDGSLGDSPLEWADGLPLEQFQADVAKAQELPPPTTTPAETIPPAQQTTVAPSG